MRIVTNESMVNRVKILYKISACESGLFGSDHVEFLLSLNQDQLEKMESFYLRLYPDCLKIYS